jgi:hypothetical protein
MNVGLPGTGIGGLFYIFGALYAPIGGLLRPETHRVGEPSRARARRNATLALGILGALWFTGWGLGHVVASWSVTSAGGWVGMGGPEAVSIVRWIAVIGTTGLLVLVLLAVQVLRLVVRRPEPRQRLAIARGTDTGVALTRGGEDGRWGGAEQESARPAVQVAP